jgi:predicted NUDIX family NTP pyrophosphohydrolase
MYVKPIERGGFPEMDDYIWTTLNDAKSLLHETQVFFLDSIKECYGN